MSLRVKLIAALTATVVVSVLLVSWGVFRAVNAAFDEVYQERTDAIVQQFRREFDRRAVGVERQVAAIAGSDRMLRLALDLRHGGYARFVNEAPEVAASHGLELLQLTDAGGTIISSAHWTARFGYKEEWIPAASQEGAFLRAEEAPQGTRLAIVAVRSVMVGDGGVFLAGGTWLDEDFLGSLVLPAETRLLLYREPPGGEAGTLLSPAGPVTDADAIMPLLEQVRSSSSDTAVRIASDTAPGESFYGIPLRSLQGELLGILLVGNSKAGLERVLGRLRIVILMVGMLGLLLAVVASGWVAGRITRPIHDMAEAAGKVAAGHWQAQVEVRSHDELGQLAEAFNRMTLELIGQRERLLQAERVAAWRELARRLAHELKNPLFPLQITIENLVRARQAAPEEFEEVFRESTATLLAELENLKNIIARFSDFARMPKPELQAVELNDLVRQAAKLLEPQLRSPGRPEVQVELRLTEDLAFIQADGDLLYRAIQNLILNALDAMPEGGTLVLRTAPAGESVLLEVTDTGSGLTEEGRQRLFTPYYTTRHHGTGLGLAIVQSVVSDHGGRIVVESEPGRGTTFRLLLPREQGEPEEMRGVSV